MYGYFFSAFIMHLSCLYRVFTVVLPFFVCLIIFQQFQSLSRHRVEDHDVKQRHQSDADIAEIPDNRVFLKSADEEHNQCENLVGGLEAPAVSEQVGDVGARIEQDSDERRKAEQRECQCDEDHADCSEMIVHCSLEKIHSGQTSSQILRCEKHNHRGTATHNDRVDQDTECLGETCANRVIAVGSGSGTWGRAGAGFIREESALDSVHQHSAKSTGNCLTKPKCLREDAGEDRWEKRQISGDDEERDHEKSARHDRHEEIEEPDCRISLKHNDRGEDHENDRRDKWRDLKRILKCRAYRVADDLADATPADQTGDCKQTGNQGVRLLSAGFLLYKMVDVVGRSAVVSTVERIRLLVFLGENCLDKCG